MRPNQQEIWDDWKRFNPRATDWISSMRDVVLRFLQDFFYSQPACARPTCFHFEPTLPAAGMTNETDERRTELIITGENTYAVEAGDKRPIIVVSRGPFGNGNTSMDNLVSIDPRTGTELYTDLFSGSIVCNCIARTTLEAERLASMVQTALLIYGVKLQKAGFFRIGAQVNISPPGAPGQIIGGDSIDDCILVTVSTACTWQVAWTIRPDAELVEGITATLEIVSRTLNGSLLNPAVLSEDGTLAITSGEGVLVQIIPWSPGT